MIRLPKPKISLPALPKPKLPDVRLDANTAMGAFTSAEVIVNNLRHAASTRAEHHSYDINLLRSLVQCAGGGMTLYLIHRRARAAAPVSMATAVISAGLSAAGRLRPTGEDDERDLRDRLVDTGLEAIPSILASLGLFASSGEGAELSQMLNFSPRDASLPFTPWEHVRNVSSLYAVYTIVGHWLEMLFCQLIKLGIVGGDYDRSNTMLWDWWLHPFPAEGIAGVLIAGGLSPLREVLLKRFGGRVAPALAISFLVNQVVCTSIDYLTGMVANRNYELWDYRNMPFNFQGQVCLQNSLVYTTAATLIAWVFYPLRDSWLRRLPVDVANLGFSALAPAYAFISLMYFV